MEKREKRLLRIKESIYRFVIGYSSILLGMHFAGAAQTLFNHEEVKQYKEVIDDFGEYLDANGVYEPVEIFDYFNYALWEGYLSKDKDFAYSEKRDIYFSNYGLGNISGRGVCLNNAGMLKDLYESYGYEAEIVLCYVPSSKISVDKDTRGNEVIHRRIEHNDAIVLVSKIFKPIAIFTGNHAVTVVYYKGEYYYFDPTNLIYLAKSDIDDLEIINGDGSFKKRYLMSFVYELSDGLKNMFGVTSDDYNLDYLTSKDPLVIELAKLEEFYQNEKDLIDDIANSLDRKSQWVIIILAFMLYGKISYAVQKEIEDIISKRCKMHESSLRAMLTLFFIVNNINKFEDVCSYLHYLINNGYLSYERGNMDFSLKKSMIVDTPSLVTIDPKDYDENFFDNFIKYYFTKKNTVTGIDDEGNNEHFYMHKEGDNKYIFYSYSQNLIFRLNENGELVNGDKKYKLLTLFKDELMNSEKFQEDIHTDIEESLCEAFYDKNKDTIEKIAKTYAYIRENK